LQHSQHNNNNNACDDDLFAIPQVDCSTAGSSLDNGGHAHGDHEEQEALLTLRRHRCRCRNIKGEPQIFGSFPSPRQRPFFPLVVVFMVGLREPQMHVKFEVANFSRCTNIKGEPYNGGSFPSPRLLPLFPLGVIL